MDATLSEVILASGNPGKLEELQAMLADTGLHLRSQGELQLTQAEETGPTFVENALLKARHAARLSGLPALADDSGLVVDALQGRPGIHSARFAGEQADDEDNNRALLEALAEVPAPQRTARFHCALVLLRHADDPAPLICQGQWEGYILSGARGEGGFGYDPLFWVPEMDATAAELEPECKHRISHRGLAMKALRRALVAGAAGD